MKTNNSAREACNGGQERDYDVHFVTICLHNSEYCRLFHPYKSEANNGNSAVKELMTVTVTVTILHAIFVCV